jgi:hypothetical protein
MRLSEKQTLAYRMLGPIGWIFSPGIQAAESSQAQKEQPETLRPLYAALGSERYVGKGRRTAGAYQRGAGNKRFTSAASGILRLYALDLAAL